MKAKIYIQNFKSLKNVELCIKRNTFLLGANGSGKSSFLKLLLFIKKNVFEISDERMHRRNNEPDLPHIVVPMHKLVFTVQAPAI